MTLALSLPVSPQSPGHGPAADAPGDLLSLVTVLRDGTEGVFLSTGSQLIEVSMLLDAARQGALSLDRLAQTDLLDRLHAEAGRQSAAFDDLAREFKDVRAGIRALTEALGQLGEDLQDVRRSVVTMRVVVLNARVTLASLHAQDQRLSNFAESGKIVVAETDDLLTRFEQVMLTIRKLVDETAMIVEGISDTLAKGVLGAFQLLMQDVSAFESRVRAVSGRGAELSRSLQALLDATGRAVSGLQVGDSTRQRLDHVAFILGHPNGADPVLQTLSEALIVDAAEVHAQMLGQLRQSVGEMITGLNGLVETHLSAFLGLTGKAVEASVLLDGTARLGQAIEALHPLQAHATDLGRSMVVEFDTFRNLISQGEEVQHSTRQIGINAVLSCMRLGSDGLALKVVAEQLQAVAREVGTRFATVRVSLDRISTLGADITQATERLVHGSIEVPERLAAAMGPMIGSVSEHLQPVNDAVRRLSDRLENLNLDFGPALRHSDQLRDLAEGLGSPAPGAASGHLSDAALAQIAAIFTIEKEREVFRAMLPGRADLTRSGQSPQQPVAEIDDGFML